MGKKLIDNFFARHCTNETLGTSDKIILKCDCDFTINLKGCPDEGFYFIAFEILIPLTFLIVIMSISFLYYRVKIKGQSVFFPATRERGLIRPRPQDSFHIAVGVFNFCQLLVSICLITESFPNATIAETIVYIPRLLGFACAVLYPISIIYSTPILKQTTYSLRIQWNPNKIFVDILAIYLMLGPLLTIVPLTAIAGYFADMYNYSENTSIFKVQAFVWSSWTIQYFITLSYVYYKLIFMLRGYIDILQRRRGDPDIETKLKKLNNAAHNLTWIVLAVLLIFFINSLEGIIIGISYNSGTFTGRIFFISWYFTVPILTFIGQMIFLYDTLKNRKSQHQNNNNTYDRINNIKSRLEEKPIVMKKRNIADLTSDQSITVLVSTNNDSDRKHLINSIISSEVKTIILSTTGTSTYETKSGPGDNINDFIEHYYFEGNDEESKDTTTPNARKSWLVKKPIRNAPKKNNATGKTDKILFFKN